MKRDYSESSRKCAFTPMLKWKFIVYSWGSVIVFRRNNTLNSTVINTYYYVFLFFSSMWQWHEHWFYSAVPSCNDNPSLNLIWRELQIVMTIASLFRKNINNLLGCSSIQVHRQWPHSCWTWPTVPNTGLYIEYFPFLYVKMDCKRALHTVIYPKNLSYAVRYTYNEFLWWMLSGKQTGIWTIDLCVIGFRTVIYFLILSILCFFPFFFLRVVKNIEGETRHFASRCSGWLANPRLTCWCIHFGSCIYLAQAI